MRYVHLTIILLNHFTNVGLLLVPQIILELTFLHLCLQVLGCPNIQCCDIGIWVSFLSPFNDISVEHISLKDPFVHLFSSLATFPGSQWHLRELDLLSCFSPTVHVTAQASLACTLWVCLRGFWSKERDLISLQGWSQSYRCIYSSVPLARLTSFTGPRVSGQGVKQEVRNALGSVTFGEWTDSLVRSTCCFCQGLGFGSQHPSQVTCSSRGPGLQGTGTRVAYGHTHTHTHKVVWGEGGKKEGRREREREGRENVIHT